MYYISKGSTLRFFAALSLFIFYVVDPCGKDLRLKLALLALIFSLSVLTVAIIFRKKEKYITIGYFIIVALFFAAYFVQL